MDKTKTLTAIGAIFLVFFVLAVFVAELYALWLIATVIAQAAGAGFWGTVAVFVLLLDALHVKNTSF